MSVTSDEVNYLIWRYLQEAGHEVTAFALQDETKVHELDYRYRDRIHIGCLVDLIQRGILYSDTENLVNEKGLLKTKEELEKTFSLFESLSKDKSQKSEFKGRFALLKSDEEVPEEVEEEEEEGEEEKVDGVKVGGEDVEMKELPDKNSPAPFKEDSKNSKPVELEKEEEAEDEFTKVLVKKESFKPSLSSCWNPVSPLVLSLGEHKSTAEIKVLSEDDSKTAISTVTLSHPLSLSADFSMTSSNEQHEEEITLVSWAPKGHYLLTASENGELRLWTAEGKLRTKLNLHHCPIISIKWSPDSTYILTLDIQSNTIIWDAATGNAIQNIDFDTLKSVSSTNNATGQQIDLGVLGSDAIWLGNKKFAIPGLSGSVVLFQLLESIPFGFLNGHTLPIGCMSYNKKVQLLATGSDDATIRIWKGNSSSSSQVLLGHTQGIVGIDWLTIPQRDDLHLVISSSLDGSIRVWNVYNGELFFANFLDGIPIYENSLSPDKKYYAVATEEGTITVFDVDPNNLKKLLIKNRSINLVGSLKPLAQYQPEIINKDDSNYVTSISWNCESKKLCIAYNLSETIIINWSD